MEKVKMFNLQTLRSHLANGVPYDGVLVDPKALAFGMKHNPSVIFDEAGIKLEMLKMGYKVDAQKELKQIKTERTLLISEVVDDAEATDDLPVSAGIPIPDDSEVVSRKGKFRK
jgi:hypothetical protein